MEQATAERTKSPQSGDATAIDERVAELRKLAKKSTEAAQEETWDWFKQLGKDRDEAALDALFAKGKAPKSLDGPTDGILVVPLIQGILDQGLSLITSVWMPWSG